MKSQSPIDLLGTVKRVETPDHLFTRIEAKIESNRLQQLKPSLVWSLSIAAAFLLIFNTFLAVNSSKNAQESQNDSSGISSFELMSDNSLYDSYE